MKCALKKKDGKQCGAHALRDDKYCFSHSEKTRLDKHRAVVRGGMTTLAPKLLDIQNRRIETENDLLEVMQGAINEALRLPISTQKVNTLGYLTNVTIAVLKSKREYEKHNPPEEFKLSDKDMEEKRRAFATLLYSDNYRQSVKSKSMHL